MPPVHLLQYLDLVTLLIGCHAVGQQVLDRFVHEILRRHLVIAKRCALAGSRQEARSPVFGAAVVERWQNRDEPGQVPILRPQPVQGPGAHAGTSEIDRSGLQLQHGTAMVDAVADHGANHAELVDVPGHIREQLTDSDSALAILLEFPRRLHQSADLIFAER